MIYRYERKFVFPALDIGRAKSSICLSPLFFSQVHTPRRVNNVYYDTADMRHYRAAINGCSRRLKVRIRWYEDELSSAQLELKIRHASVGTKIIVKLPELTIDSFFCEGGVRKILGDSDAINHKALEVIGEDCLYPVLYNSYSREYYLSKLTAIRATIDTDLRFSDPGGLGDHMTTSRLCSEGVIEFKYPLSLGIDEVLGFSTVPWRLSRFSKYVTGLSMLRN